MFASFTNRLLIARSFHHASAMPAKRAPKSSKKPQMDPTPPQEPQPRSPVAALTSTSTRISLLIKPNAKESRVTEVTEEWVGIAVAAPPREGEANREVVEFVAQIRKTDVEVIAGHKAREKVVRVDGVMALDVLRLLREAVEGD
ncbi:hypothetical protein BC938DRAFT_481497, partial [Jimgerdemannia flammicorona]